MTRTHGAALSLDGARAIACGEGSACGRAGVQNADMASYSVNMGLIACKYRSAEWRHEDIELAAHDLSQHLDNTRARTAVVG